MGTCPGNCQVVHMPTVSLETVPFLFSNNFIGVWNVPRRRNQDNGRRETNPFKFITWQWSDDQLRGLKQFLGGMDGDYSEHILNVVEREWKLSISQHYQSGRYLCTLTDKRGRPGCNNCCFVTEHSDISLSLLGAVYLATEILESGNPRDNDTSDLDLW